MMNFFNKHKYGIILLAPGIIAGFFYWKYVGCMSGTCPLTSNWQLTLLFGGLVGYFIGDSIDDKRKKSKKNIEKEDGTV